MKIKAVCEMTGLTDRSIRYYIEEELLLPSYTENYLGRKTFDFSDDDVQKLKDIAVLRKFGFSIAEIKQMQATPKESYSIAQALKQRKQSAIAEEQVCVQALDQLDKNRFYTVPKLAAQLSVPVAEEPLPPEDSTLNIRKAILRFLKAFFMGIIIVLPWVLSILVVFNSIHIIAYPGFNLKWFIVVLFVLSPTWLILLIPKDKVRFPWVIKARKVLVVLCILCVPISTFFSFGIISLSETTNIHDYRRFDTDCLANRYPLFQDLFPIWPNLSDPNAKYLYRNLPGMDYTYDIYAEWSLPQTEFDQEIARVQEVFSDYRTPITVETENYTCLIIHSGKRPFEEVTDSYTYYIFAYDEENLTVRYILCDSLDNGIYQPYYLSLDW